MNDRRKSESLRRAVSVRVPAVAALLLAATQVGCSPAVPEDPTWTEDVRSILMANCARCHTDPPIGGAPNYLRLDRYETWPGERIPVLQGAAASSASVALRAASPDRPMPPIIGPLNGRQQEILQLWADNGAPRGEPLADNAAPTVTVGPGQVDVGANTATFDYEILDDEGDFVVGQIVGVSPDDGSDVVIAPTMYRGTGQVMWDFTDMPAGTYPLSAIVDDGNTLVTVEVGSVDVPVPAMPVPDIPDDSLGRHGGEYDQAHHHGAYDGAHE